MRIAFSTLVFLVTCVASIYVVTQTMKDGTGIEWIAQSYENAKFLINDGERSPKPPKASDVKLTNARIAPRPEAELSEIERGHLEASKARWAPPAALKHNLQLEGTDLEAWKLARETASRSGIWEPCCPTPYKHDLESSPAGDYVFRIPVIDKKNDGKDWEPGTPPPKFMHCVVYISTISGRLRVERHEFVNAR